MWFGVAAWVRDVAVCVVGIKRYGQGDNSKWRFLQGTFKVAPFEDGAAHMGVHGGLGQGQYKTLQSSCMRSTSRSMEPPSHGEFMPRALKFRSFYGKCPAAPAPP